MTAFADSSALVTLYATETPVLSVGQEGVVVSAIARVEVPSALWRKVRLTEITASQAATLVRAFEADWRGTTSSPPAFRPIAVSSRLLADAAGLVANRDLRALDAIQLASAIAAREAEPSCTDFVVLDRQLRDAAARDGFRILPASA